MLFRSYIGSYLPSGEQLHTVGVNVQWWRYARVLYSVPPNTMAKPVTKTPRGREQHHMNGYTLGCLQEQAKWPTGAPIQLPLEFCIFAKSLFTKKKLVLNQAIAALRPSVGLPGRFATVWKNRTGHTHTPTHTHTHNYCNPAEHVRRGLIRNINVDCHSHRHWGASPFHLPYWLQCSVFTPTSV